MVGFRSASRTDSRAGTTRGHWWKSSIPQARRRLRGVPALLAEQKNRY
jgi:hypothetical protein